MTMLSHAQIWAALDRLAARAGLSPSGLAKKAGLDPTTFNKSKRITPDGRARWPSTESVSKSLNATGVTVEQFVSLITEGAPAPARAIPMLALGAVGPAQFDDNGFPMGAGWDEIAFPAIEDEHAYALEIAGDIMAPVYRDGTQILVSPAAPIRRNDRVVVRMKNGELMVVELKRKTAKTIELKPIGPADAGERVLAAEDIAWIARIVWASQ